MPKLSPTEPSRRRPSMRSPPSKKPVAAPPAAKPAKRSGSEHHPHCTSPLRHLRHSATLHHPHCTSPLRHLRHSATLHHPTAPHSLHLTRSAQLGVTNNCCCCHSQLPELLLPLIAAAAIHNCRCRSVSDVKDCQSHAKDVGAHFAGTNIRTSNSQAPTLQWGSQCHAG